jgi:hypothetical protein
MTQPDTATGAPRSQRGRRMRSGLVALLRAYALVGDHGWESSVASDRPSPVSADEVRAFRRALRRAEWPVAVLVAELPQRPS